MRTLVAAPLLLAASLALTGCSLLPAATPHKTMSDSEFADAFEQQATSAGIVLNTENLNEHTIAEGGRQACEAVENIFGDQKPTREDAVGRVIGKLGAMSADQTKVAEIYVPLALDNLCPDLIQDPH